MFTKHLVAIYNEYIRLDCMIMVYFCYFVL